MLLAKKVNLLFTKSSSKNVKVKVKLRFSAPSAGIAEIEQIYTVRAKMQYKARADFVIQ